ncbi:MAG: ChbG/HpnK family deacetylase [Candidatus Sulfotelmatobacter sp.]
MKIIINADDLGISESVNDAIFDGMGRGVITSATMLSNGPAAQMAARRIAQFTKRSFGVHLNLTEFEPLCAGSRAELASILNGDHCFNGNSIREVRITANMLRAIFREWCAQIENLIRLGVEPSHLDAHHHVHTIPQLLPVMSALRRKYKINKVRISRNMYDGPEYPGKILLAKKYAFNSALKLIGFRTTGVFTDLATFIKLCSGCPPRTSSVELMTHPGALPRGEETELLEGDWPRMLSYKINLVSYKDL